MTAMGLRTPIMGCWFKMDRRAIVLLLLETSTNPIGGFWSLLQFFSQF